MLNLEEKFVINLVREKKYDDWIKWKDLIDFDKFIEILLDQNLFLQLYDKLLLIFEDKYKRKLKIFYKYYTEHYDTKLDFQKKIFTLLSSNNIRYILQKGLSYEHLIYNDFKKRYYNDIDLIIDNEQIDFAIKLLRDNFEILSIKDFSHYYSSEMKVRLKYKNVKYTLEIKQRHREAEFDFTDFMLDNIKEIQFRDVLYNSTSNEIIFTSMCLYIYNFFERLDSWIYTSKMKLGYFYDLKMFLENKNLDVKRLKTIIFNFKISHKIQVVLQYLKEIFLECRGIIDLQEALSDYSCLHNIEYKINDNNYLNISVYDKMFHRKEIKEFITQYLQGSFIFSGYKSYYDIYKNSLFLDDLLQFDYKVFFDKDNIYLEFDNYMLPTNGKFVLYIALYFYNKYGEFVSPYVPISIRIDGSNIYAYNRFTVDFEDFVYRKSSEKLMPYQREEDIIINYDNNNKSLKIKVDLSRIDVYVTNNTKIGFNISIIQIFDDEKVKVLKKVSDKDDEPIILKIVENGEN